MPASLKLDPASMEKNCLVVGLESELPMKYLIGQKINLNEATTLFNQLENFSEAELGEFSRIISAVKPDIADMINISADMKSYNIKPDITEKLQTAAVEIGELHAQLMERADKNWSDYRHLPHNTTPDNLYNVSIAVIAHRDARIYLNEYKDFDAEQLKCLLQFADPVDLVADYLDPESDISEMPDILSDILENQEKYKEIYALAEKPLLDAKLYSPVFANLWEYDFGGGGLNSVEFSQTEAAWYHTEIWDAVQKYREPEESERGLMAYYRDGDSLGEKVHSLFIDVEVHGEKLWAVTSLKLTEPLTKDEFGLLQDYIEGQFSDGWGEGFEQQDIKTEDGDINVHLWKNDEFYILTQEQFAAKQGLSLPPDILSQAAPSPAELERQLQDRIAENFATYKRDLMDSGMENMFRSAAEIAAVAEIYYYVTGEHDFTRSEIEFFLKFENPLEVLTDRREAQLYDVRDTVAEITKDSDFILNDLGYKLVSDEPVLDSASAVSAVQASAQEVSDTPNTASELDFAEREQQLQDRLADNFAAYKRDILDLSGEGIFKSAAEIAAVSESFEYFSKEHVFDESEVDFLLKFENPLEVISDRWNITLEHLSNTLDAIFDNQEHTLEKGGYNLMSDKSASAPAVPETPKTAVQSVGKDEQPSVMEQIRQAAKEIRERTAEPKDTPGKKTKTEPDL